MSYVCDYCSKPVGPHIPLHLIEVEGERRSIVYTNQRRDAETGEKSVITTHGTEIVREFKICPVCSGTKPRIETQINALPHIALCTALQGHGKGCKKPYVECVVCLRNERAYGTIPAKALAVALETPKAKGVRISIGSLVVSSLLQRAKDLGKRAAADFAAAYSMMKTYERRGGGI